MNFDKLVENKIREAQEQGVFDNLARKGQLDFEDESSVPEDMRLAMRMLKSQGLTPDWIEQDKGMRKKLDDARVALARSWNWRKQKLAQTADPSERAHVDDEWRRARDRFEVVVKELNAEIFTFNLRAPSLTVQRRPIRSSEEYRALGVAE